MTDRSDIRFLPVLNESGGRTGVRMTETEVHRQHLWHACVNVCVTDSKGYIYQQYRGYTTRIFPGKFDMFLASDHIVEDDDVPVMAVARALAWRVGVQLPTAVLESLQPVLKTKSMYWVADPSYAADKHGNHGYFHYAFEYIYVVRLDGLGHEIPLRYQGGRVLGVRRYSLARMLEDYQSPHISEEYRQYAHRTPHENQMLEAIYNEVVRLTR
ncbi:MAG TPA: hypothetical protein VFT59_04925 [Candidatus Saccharimonadales bacterium]|nr:hypothetical protein [Candidatus Saccharimonadales bacterium]